MVFETILSTSSSIPAYLIIIYIKYIWLDFGQIFNKNNIGKRDVYINNGIINTLEDIDNNKAYYNVVKNGTYNFEIKFYDIITNLENLFNGCNNLIYIDLSNFDTSNVINMRHMFYQYYFY